MRWYTCEESEERCGISTVHSTRFFTDVEFPIEIQLRRYAINLLTRSTFTEKFLEYAIAILPEDGIKRLIKYISDNLNNDEELFSSYERLTDLKAVTEKTILLLSNDKLKVSKEQLNRYVLQIMTAIGQEFSDKSTTLLTPELRSLKDIFHLNEEEVQVIIFCFCQEHSDTFEQLVKMIMQYIGWKQRH